MTGIKLFSSLSKVTWSVALSTFGNNHATLIGLLVEWWISGGKNRWALEGGPSYGGDQLGRGQCDAILGVGNETVGVLEVEGTRHDYTLRKIDQYFNSKRPPLATLSFGIFLGYFCKARGRGSARIMLPLPQERWLKTAKAITARYQGRQLIVLGLEKSWQPALSGPLTLSHYYQCRPTHVWGALVSNGKIIRQQDAISMSRLGPI